MSPVYLSRCVNISMCVCMCVFVGGLGHTMFEEGGD